jgi:ribonuclease E
VETSVVETPAEVEAAKASEPVQTELAVDQAQETPVTETVAVEKVDAEVESAEKAEADKPARPRRPRGRPPKKAPAVTLTIPW